MENSIKHVLEQVIKILIVFIVILIIIGGVKVGKRFLSRMQSNVETVPSYDDHIPQYYD